MPASQLLQTEAPVPEYVPAAQAAHVSTPAAPVAAEYSPAPQSWHVLPEAAPGAVECLPAPQSEHAAEPRAAL